MYAPKQFREDRKEVLLEVMRQLHFGALIIHSEGKFISTHIPLIVKEEEGKVFLDGHVSRQNDLWKCAQQKSSAMVIFQGANAYIQPGWYETKKKTGRVVPTWNYQVVNCYGHLEIHESTEWLLRHLEELVNINEAKQANPWKISDAPKEYIDSQLRHIVGLRFHVAKLEGIWKMNQHHPEANRKGVIEGLSSSPVSSERDVGVIMDELERGRS